MWNLWVADLSDLRHASKAYWVNYDDRDRHLKRTFAEIRRHGVPINWPGATSDTRVVRVDLLGERLVGATLRAGGKLVAEVDNQLNVMQVVSWSDAVE